MIVPLTSVRFAHSCSSVDERPGASGVFQDRCDSGCCGPDPCEIAVTITARQIKTAAVELAHHFGDSARFQECLEQQFKPCLHLKVRILDDDA
jgi:hypothetical protein